jgi:hypothetical protein
MATVLNLIEGATTTGLNDAGATGTKMLHYTPKAGMISEPTVTEQVTLLIDVATVALMDSEREEIILRLYNAHARQTDHARDKTYVSYQPDGVAGAWRSEILDGKIINETDIHKEGWAIKKIEVTIEWVRRNFWEGAEAQIPLTNTNGTDDTAGLEVFNCNDGVGTPPNDRVNYVDVKAADVDGELPAATRLELTRDYTSADDFTIFYIGQNVHDPANHAWTYEGEDATGGTPTVDANSSGGDYNLVSVATGPSFQDLLTWTVAAADVDDALGGMMKFIILFSDALMADPNKIWWKLHLEVAGYTVYETGRIKFNSLAGGTHRVVGTFNFPPWLRGETGNEAIDIVLEGQQETGGAVTSKIDVLYMIPADGWREIYSNDDLLDTERMVDDGIEGFLYIDDGSGTGKRSACVGYGNPIMVEPGKLQRLYFMCEPSEIDRKHTVKLHYRPRRLTV